MTRTISAAPVRMNVNNSSEVLDLVPKEIYKGMIRLYALHRATKSPLSSRQMADELLRHGCALSMRSVAAVLSGLAKKGYLIHGQNGGASSDAMFIATAAGRRAVVRARAKLSASAEIFGE